MKIKLNNQSIDIKDNISIKDFVENHVQVSDFAIAINNNFIPKDRYHAHFLRRDDQVELLVPMQGG